MMINLIWNHRYLIILPNSGSAFDFLLFRRSFHPFYTLKDLVEKFALEIDFFCYGKRFSVLEAIFEPFSGAIWELYHPDFGEGFLLISI